MSAQPIIFDDLEIGELAMDFDHESPQEVIRWGLQTFGERVAVVTSLQRDSMAILDMAYRINPNVRAITVDTGRLPPQTLTFLEEVRQHFPKADIEVVHPDEREVDQMVERNGSELFKEAVSMRFLCCHIRKVRPLVGALRGLDGWFTGLRRDQWASRAAIKKLELDHDHGGIVKLNPLADWTQQEVKDYVDAHDVPTHPLYDEGYVSIGCAPCSRPLEAGESKRDGRWWWEEGAPKECGMNCPIETGGFEHEAELIMAEVHDDRAAKPEPVIEPLDFEPDTDHL